MICKCFLLLHTSIQENKWQNQMRLKILRSKVDYKWMLAQSSSLLCYDLNSESKCETQRGRRLELETKKLLYLGAWEGMDMSQKWAEQRGSLGAWMTELVSRAGGKPGMSWTKCPRWNLCLSWAGIQGRGAKPRRQVLEQSRRNCRERKKNN